MTDDLNKNKKLSIKKARPWHVFDPGKKVSEEIAVQRYEICQQCPELIKLTNQCKKCGCFMNLKVKIENARCPIGKW